MAEHTLMALPREDSSKPSRATTSLSYETSDTAESAYEVALKSSLYAEKKKWGNQWDFLMAVLAFAVGLGNIWRFPYKAAENGGGSFLFPYMVILLLVGRPLAYLEFAFGQFSSRGPLKVWDILPLFRGVGIGASFACFIVTSYYVVIMSWATLYIVFSFQNPLPWANDSADYFTQHVLHVMPEEEFSKGLGLGGSPVDLLVAAVAVDWIAIFIILNKGVTAGGKIAYFTALFPYILLSILLVRALWLENSLEGIKYLLTPRLNKIFLPKTWLEASGQVFFSLSVSFGSCISFSSYNHFHHNIGRSILILCVMDTLISLMASVCVFSVVGNLAYKTGVPIENISSSGGGLAFITFPAVLARMGSYPAPQIFSVLFFSMLFVLALGSANGLVAVFVTILEEMFPSLKTWIIASILTVIGFMISLIYTTPAGSYIIDIADTLVGNEVILCFAFFEVIGIMWIHGFRKFLVDLEFMLEGPVCCYWVVCWVVVTPLLIFSVAVASFVKLDFNPKWPPSAVYASIWLAISVLLLFPLGTFLECSKYRDRNLEEVYKLMISPTSRYGPKDPAIREEWLRYKMNHTYKFRLCGWLKTGFRKSKPSKILILQPCKLHGSRVLADIDPESSVSVVTSKV